MAEEVSSVPDPREMDMLLSTGERISCALCAMAINDLGHRAISLTGSQAGIVTDTSHTKARILDVRGDRIRAALDDDLIVLVAGFQGVSTARDVTTLGRGGSDTTAVALAAAMDAEVCEIYTDVAGVFSADPRIVPDARKLPVVSFEEMLEMSASGAGVLQLRSVEYARNHGVRIHCRSSFTEAPGTFVVGEEETMERPLITAVTHSRDEARMTLLGVPDHPGVAGRIFTALADANVNVDMIIQDEPEHDGVQAHMSFTVPRADLRVAKHALQPVIDEFGIRVSDDPEMGKVSVVGAGMKSHPGVAARVFATLGDQGINIQMISTSPIKISCVVTADAVDRAVRALHEAFELGAEQVEAEHPFGAPA
jgi:aspartate kinase